MIVFYDSFGFGWERKVRGLVRFREKLELSGRAVNLARTLAKESLWASRKSYAQIRRPNQVWAMDITYIPMARGLVLAVVLDWFSRRVLAWRS